jgi:uncharacterized protein YrrD
MLIELSLLNKLPVGSFDEGGLVGKVAKVIISRENAKILGFLVKLPGFLGQTKVASFEDIVSIDQAGIVLRSSEMLVDKDEIVRIDKLLKDRFELIGLKAIAKNKTSLGIVQDALFDSDSGDLMRLYIKKFFKDYVFERSQIIEMTLKYVRLETERKEKAKKTIESLAQAEIA